jgi:PAS domain S-box-containing protein
MLAEEKLRRSESRLAEAQQLAQCGNWERNLGTGRMTWSNELYNIFGISPEKFSHTFEGFIALLNSRSRQKAVELRKLITTKGGSFEVEYNITVEGGDERVIHVIGHAETDTSGNIIRLFGTAQNITARKKSEAALEESARKYKFLFEHNPMPMWLVDKDSLRFIAVNEAALHHYGYTRSEFLSMTSADLKAPEERERFSEFRFSPLAGPFNAGIWEHRKKDGIIISVEIIMHQIVYDDKQAYLVLVKDVSEKLRAEEEIKMSYQQLKALTSHLEGIREEERSRIALEIHDELGQQLTGLKMDASWILKKLKDSDKDIGYKMAGMIALIEETVRTVKRISSELRPGILDDLGLIAALEWQSQEFSKRTGIECIFFSSIMDAEPEKTLATNIFRVYQEALTNVARHSMAVRVETTIEIQDGKMRLIITDNGRGFDKDEVKGRNSLGLIGMRERANNFNGLLNISTEVGRGTTIVLELPYMEREHCL